MDNMDLMHNSFLLKFLFLYFICSQFAGFQHFLPEMPLPFQSSHYSVGLYWPGPCFSCLMFYGALVTGTFCLGLRLPLVTCDQLTCLLAE